MSVTKDYKVFGDNISLSKLEEITKSENIPLVLFDVKNKRLIFMIIKMNQISKNVLYSMTIL